MMLKTEVIKESMQYQSNFCSWIYTNRWVDIVSITSVVFKTYDTGYREKQDLIITTIVYKDNWYIRFKNKLIK